MRWSRHPSSLLPVPWSTSTWNSRLIFISGVGICKVTDETRARVSRQGRSRILLINAVAVVSFTNSSSNPHSSLFHARASYSLRNDALEKVLSSSGQDVPMQKMQPAMPLNLIHGSCFCSATQSGRQNIVWSLLGRECTGSRSSTYKLCFSDGTHSTCDYFSEVWTERFPARAGKREESQ